MCFYNNISARLRQNKMNKTYIMITAVDKYDSMSSHLSVPKRQPAGPDPHDDAKPTLMYICMYVRKYIFAGVSE